MKAGVLFSGGKDSALAALLLAPHYEVEVVTFASDAGRNLAAVEEAGAALGLAWRQAPLPEGVLGAAVDRIVADGYPNNAINLVHRWALEALAREYPVVADGTRFDDRVPMLGPDEARSMMDRCGCAYVRPLLGFPRAEVDRLAGRYLAIERGETGRIPNGDYEMRTAGGAPGTRDRPGPVLSPVARTDPGSG